MTKSEFKIVILDDDMKYCQNIVRVIEKNIHFNYSISIYHKYDDDFKQFLKANMTPSIYIIDVDLKQRDANGITAAAEINRIKNGHHRVIYLTNDQSAAESAINFHTNPAGFIRKNDPDNTRTFIKLLLDTKVKIDNSVDEIDEKYINVYVNRKPIRIAVSHIIYFNLVKDKTVEIHAIRDDMLSKYTTTCSLEGMIISLKDERFFRLTRRLCVNLSYIAEVFPNTSTLELKCGIILTAPEKKLEEMLRCMQKLSI